MTSDRAARLAFIGVSNQTELLPRWRKVANLTSERAFSQVWTRHLADCAQLIGYAPLARRWVHLGSGAGFPGMVITILLAKMQGGAEVHCVESDQSECAFLREVARATDVSCPRSRRSHRNVQSLRVVASGRNRLSGTRPLPRLLELANVRLMLDAVGIFPRGRWAAAETFSVASQFQFKSFRNSFGPNARIECVHSRDSRTQAQK